MAALTAAAIVRRLRTLADPDRAAGLQRFFKTGPGDYGEGDQFLGLTVPMLHTLAVEVAPAVRGSDAGVRPQGQTPIPLAELGALLDSAWHEARLLALMILVRQYARADTAQRERIHRLYLRKTARINNWDLVDSSAESLVGAHLGPRDMALLKRLARSPLLWERRIAIIATFHGIKRGEFAPALAIARLLVADDHDLIHKAVGWMLREIGKRDRAVEEAFLREHAAEMPRTMLRYAIERFPEPRRQRYLRAGKTERTVR